MHTEFEFAPVAAHARRGFGTMLVVMLGFTFFSASMYAGANLGNALRAPEFLLAVLAGNLLLGAYTGLLAYVAAHTGLSTHLLARRAFGQRGAALPSVLLGVTQVGWFGVGVAMFALPVAQMFPALPRLPLLLVAGACMSLTAYYGIKSLTILSSVAVPAIALLGCGSMAKAISSTRAISPPPIAALSPIARAAKATDCARFLARVITVRLGRSMAGRK